MILPMVERILELIRQFGLSPSQFADEIGVQRSAMSHLVSGRNNPSLEFIMKVLKRFPQVNMEWLVSGTGTMTRDEQKVQPVEVTSPELFQQIPEPSAPARDEPPVQDEKPEPKRPVRAKKETPGEKEIERIIIIYNDRTFKEILPE